MRNIQPAAYGWILSPALPEAALTSFKKALVRSLVEEGDKS